MNASDPVSWASNGRQPRIAIIGAGLAAVVHLRHAGRLSCFQRMPQWMFPLFQTRHSAAWKRIMATVPDMHRLMYHLHRLSLEHSLGPATLGNGRMQRLFEAFNADLAQAVQNSVWATGGCQSWYIDASGDPNHYSHRPAQFYRDMRRPILDESDLEPA